MNIVKEISDRHIKPNVEKFNIGDTVRVYAKIVEGDKERLQGFEGVVIARKGSGACETFTVRKIVQDIGVERIFPIHSPKVDRIKIIKRGKVRKAKLYYLRGRIGSRATKIEEKISSTPTSAPGPIPTPAATAS